MKTLQEISRILKAHKAELRERYTVKEIEIFGSHVRGEQGKKSDVDILVEFSGTIDLFTFMELEEYLSTLVGSKVDLVMKETLKPRIREGILKEAVPV